MNNQELYTHSTINCWKCKDGVLHCVRATEFSDGALYLCDTCSFLVDVKECNDETYFGESCPKPNLEKYRLLRENDSSKQTSTEERK